MEGSAYAVGGRHVQWRKVRYLEVGSESLTSLVGLLSFNVVQSLDWRFGLWVSDRRRWSAPAKGASLNHLAFGLLDAPYMNIFPFCPFRCHSHVQHDERGSHHRVLLAARSILCLSGHFSQPHGPPSRAAQSTGEWRRSHVGRMAT